MTRAGLIAAAAAAWMALAPATRAQEGAAPAAEPEAAQEATKPKPRPKPKPKPKAKPAEKPKEKPAEKPAEKESEGGAAEAKPSAGGTAPASRTAPEAPAANPIPAAGPALNFAAPPVVCEPGQAVHYQGAGNDPGAKNARNAELWVTRSGTITIDNPLRPLTPDVTRVLQVVVGGKVATAYGPDTLSLRRGGSPATLEGTIGGRIKWDASLVPLPDSLPINAETGQTLAELRFHECGSAPSAKLLPPPKARRMAPTPEAVASEAEKAEKAAKAAAKASVNPGRATPAAPPASAVPPRTPGLQLPQGAIP